MIISNELFSFNFFEIAKAILEISLSVKDGNKNLFDQITSKGVIADWREPDVIRVAPVPLYNSFLDVFNFYKILEDII